MAADLVVRPEVNGLPEFFYHFTGISEFGSQRAEEGWRVVARFILGISLEREGLR